MRSTDQALIDLVVAGTMAISGNDWRILALSLQDHAAEIRVAYERSGQVVPPDLERAFAELRGLTE